MTPLHRTPADTAALRLNGWTIPATRTYATSPFAARHDTRAAEYAERRAELAAEHPHAPAYKLDEAAAAHCAVAAPAGGWAK